MDSCEKEFESAGQEARRLAIALNVYGSSRSCSGKKISAYLSLRSGLP